MKEFNQANREVFDDRETLDCFEHPVLSSGLTNRIVKGMTAEHRRVRIHRWIYRLSLPAAAAMVAIVGAFMITKEVPTKTGVSQPVAITTVAVTNEDLTKLIEKEQTTVYNLYADLDFDSLTSAQTQASTVVTTTADQTDEWDTLLIEVIGG
jgi:hypothetical protein